jgi:ankyrin repeat protein
VEAMRFLLEKDPYLLSKFTKDGGTPLHAAAYGGQVEAMRFLLEKDPYLLLKFRNDGWTPLHYAALKGQVEAGKWLYEQKTSLLTISAKDGSTALSIAKEKEHKDFIEWIQALVQKEHQTQNGEKIRTAFTSEKKSPVSTSKVDDHKPIPKSQNSETSTCLIQ